MFLHRKSQDLGFCHQSKKHNFLVIGHAGGDPLGHCENTLEATRSALKLGANAIEVDIAISKDDVIFLWHDPNPLGLHSLARRYICLKYILSKIFSVKFSVSIKTQTKTRALIGRFGIYAGNTDRSSI